MKVLVKNSIQLNRILIKLIKSPSFITITLFGNAIIIGFSLAFYFVEAHQNNSVNSFLDALWWGFATATTVGYGDITPTSSFGKIIGIALMLIGTALFAIYTGLFAEAFLADESFRLKSPSSKVIAHPPEKNSPTAR